MEIITSRKNGSVRLMRELSRERSARESSGLFAAEGDHLCVELCRCSKADERSGIGFEIKLALYTEKAEKKYPDTVKTLGRCSEQCAVISEELAEYISDTKTPQGLFAAAVTPKAAAIPQNAKRAVVLDGVQDPANVGTIIRTAEALGIDFAALGAGCADIWSPKTLRASMGSVFRLPCISGGAVEIISTLKKEFSVYSAMLDESAARLGSFEFPEKSAVVIGSEGKGVSKEAADLCGGSVYIPISGAESLNAAAAAAIILWELSKGK